MSEPTVDFVKEKTLCSVRLEFRMILHLQAKQGHCCKFRKKLLEICDDCYFKFILQIIKIAVSSVAPRLKKINTATCNLEYSSHCNFQTAVSEKVEHVNHDCKFVG